MSHTEENAQETRFSDLDLPPYLLETITKMGFEKPSPIQALAIPVALSGKDLVGIAQTGSGKTAAFGLPILTKIDTSLRKPQAIVVCPTRELAVQVQRALMEFGKEVPGLRMATLYGGAAYDSQIRDLRGGAQVIVGTPGRIMDHLKKRLLDPSEIRLAVLDEADRMLDMGFREDMETLLGQMPEGRQTLFFSATMNPAVTRLIKTFSHDPDWIEVESTSRSADTVEQGHYNLRWQSKPEVLFRLLEIDPPRQAIIFCNTKRVVDECTEALLSNGFPADRLHGDMTQPMRDRVLRRFRKGEVSLLVATDVAGRGLDVEAVDLVINYDLPRDPEDYVHRIGRTGRAGREGRAVSLVAQREFQLLRRIQKYGGQKINDLEIPTKDQIHAKRATTLIDEVREQIETDRDRGPINAAKALDILLKAAPTAVAEAIPAEQPNSTDQDQGHSELAPEESSSDPGSDSDANKEEANTPAPPAPPADWESIARALFALWSSDSSRTIEPIFEDGGGQRKHQQRNRQDKDDHRGNQQRGGKKDWNEDRGSRDRGTRDRGPRDRRDSGGQDSFKGRDQNRGRNVADNKGRGDFVPPPVPNGMRRVFVGVGKLENVRPGELAGMLYNESGAPDGVIGRIRLFTKHTLIDIDEQWAEKIVISARKARYRGRPFRIRFDEYVD